MADVRLVLVAAVVLTLSLVCAAERNPAVVVVPNAEDVKDAGDEETTTYLVRDPYPGNETATMIEEAMSARGWTLLHNAPGFSEEHRLDGTTLHRFRMQAKDVEQLLSDIPPVHFATQVWTDSGGNLVRYALDRRCAYETAGMHSVYVTVRVTFFTPAQYRHLKTRARTEADGDRVRVLPTPKPTPWP